MEDQSLANTTSGRVPPQNIEAEKSLLGALLLSDKSFPNVLELLKAEDFYDPRHVDIFAGMMSLYDDHQPIDLMTLTSKLKDLKTLKGIGGAPYLTELTNFVPTAAHVEAYAELVSQSSIRRKLIAAGENISKAAYDGKTDIQVLLGQAEKQLFAVSDKTVKSDYGILSDLLVEAYERMEESQRNRGQLQGLKTGFRDLDDKTAGLHRGDLIILGARPAMGKTTLAQNLALNVARYNGPNAGVMFFSMEMNKAEIVDRMVSDISGVESWKIRKSMLSDDDFVRIGDALGELGEVPLYIDDTSSLTILGLQNKVRRAAHEHPLSMIIVDYLQLIQGSDRYAGNRVLEIAEISRGLKVLAREMRIPIIALAQLSRNVTGRDDPRPVLSDLRDSGSIEQDADIVLFLHRPDYYKQNKDDYVPTNITELIMAKHRHGPVGKIELYFHSELNRFSTLDKTHSDE